MEKLDYKNTYHRLVTKENLDRIKNILNEHEYYDKNTVEQLEIVPFLLLQWILH